jgi:hypothetical protein
MLLISEILENIHRRAPKFEEKKRVTKRKRVPKTSRKESASILAALKEHPELLAEILGGEKVT